MSIAMLLADCANCGIRLRAGADGKLLFEGPREAVTAELIERLKANKRQVLQAIQRLEANSQPVEKHSATQCTPPRPPQPHNTPGTPTIEQSASGPSAASATTILPWRNPYLASRRPNVTDCLTPKPTPIPPASILASPIVICPACHHGRVLAELRKLTDGTCWDCWFARQHK